MLSINAYYNGHEYIPLENSSPKKNQKVIITLLEDFMSPGKEKPFRKYVGKLKSEFAHEIMDALADCEKVDIDEW
jgi:hypothetical protein